MTRQSTEIREVIRIENLNKTYKFKGKEVVALKDVTLTVNKGDIFGIVGVSGAGKSTLARCINLLEKPTSGKITVNGVDLSALSEKNLNLQRRKIAMIFQNFNLFNQRTVFRNVAFPLEIAGADRQTIDSRVKALLGYVGLDDKADSYPSQLSGGQKQRVAIARALANNPDVLLCDEATSALDSLTAYSILQLLKDINCKLGVTIVFITHEIGAVKNFCNKVAVLDDAGIAECGSVEKVFDSPASPVTRKILHYGGVK